MARSFRSRAVVIALAFVVTVGMTAGVAVAQTFSSGSTGADGALDLSTRTCPNDVCEVQLPPSGVLNYTTVRVPVGKTLTFRKNLANTPVVMLAQGDVGIDGGLFVSPPKTYDNTRPNREPGPGGFYGGIGGISPGSGFGPGGGNGGGSQGFPGAAARWVGPLSLVPIVGGSGGGGSVSGPSNAACDGSGDGGGGGGAIVIASSASISVTGSIIASGANFCLGPGSGGAVRLVSNQLRVTGQIFAKGGGNGVIRFEAPAGAITFTGTADPAAVLSTINPSIFASAPTALSIVSVGGFAVPVYAGQRFDTVDVLLPQQLPDPIDVVVSATNIPIGTPVTLSFGTANAGTVVPGVLSGSTQSSTATVRVSGLNRTALAYLFVSATFDVPPSAAPSAQAAADAVARVRVSAPPGGAPRVEYLRADGTPVAPSTLPAEFLRRYQR